MPVRHRVLRRAGFPTEGRASTFRRERRKGDDARSGGSLRGITRQSVLALRRNRTSRRREPTPALGTRPCSTRFLATPAGGVMPASSIGEDPRTTARADIDKAEGIYWAQARRRRTTRGQYLAAEAGE